MADDFDRSIGGLIAVAMQSTMVAFVVAIAALALASLTFSTAYYFIEDSGEIIDVAVLQPDGRFVHLPRKYGLRVVAEP